LCAAKPNSRGTWPLHADTYPSPILRNVGNIERLQKISVGKYLHTKAVLA